MPKMLPKPTAEELDLKKAIAELQTIKEQLHKELRTKYSEREIRVHEYSKRFEDALDSVINLQCALTSSRPSGTTSKFWTTTSSPTSKKTSRPMSVAKSTKPSAALSWAKTPSTTSSTPSTPSATPSST